MTGFKEGASPSGFDDDDDDREESAADEESYPTEPTDIPTSGVTETDSGGLPWKYRRENARDGRPRTKQLHYQKETERREGTFQSNVEAVVGENVELTDLREAAVLVAMEHVDEVADQLREWGYDYDG